MDHIIYTCFDRITPFVKLHLTALKIYCNRYSIDSKVILQPENILPKFSKYAAYDHFINSKYSKMLFLDWDIIINRSAKNIFDEHEGIDMSVYYLPDNLFPDDDYINHYDNFKKLIDAPGEFELGKYFNSGVVLVSRDVVVSIYNEMKSYYEKIISKVRSGHREGRQDWYEYTIENSGREEFLFNYIVTKNNINTYGLDRKWNMAFEEPTSSGNRLHTDAERLRDDGYFLHFNKSHYRDKINSMKEAIGATQVARYNILDGSS